MDIEEFIFIRYRDNVIIVSDMVSKLYNDFGLIKDDSIRVINRIFDYQRSRYGDILDCNNYVEHSIEEKRQLSIKACQRRTAKRRYRERR